MDVGLVILDGWGLGGGDRDAIAAAETPVFDDLTERGAVGTLVTHGRRVGLPEGQMGNSEVGHLNIGAGQVVVQESTRVTNSIAAWRGADTAAAEDPPLGENRAIGAAIDAAGPGGRVHLLGLVSDGGVHAYQDHLHALATLVSERDRVPVVHAFTDGRDTDPTGGRGYLATLQDHLADVGGLVATVIGRYYAMDRDENWTRTRAAYDAIVARTADHTAPDAVTAVGDAYERGETDEFVAPTLVGVGGNAALADGDAAIHCNFRADRARQLTRMLADIGPAAWDGGTDPPDAHVATMTEYDRGFDLPVAFPPDPPEGTLGETLAAAGRTQLRVAETEKHAHVTYFLDGGREVAFEGAQREIVPSPEVATYDRQPAMNAPEMTDRAVRRIETTDPDVVVCNYANPDMVGHTGDFAAAVAAVEAVDTGLGRLVGAVRAAGAHVLITADHGNADEMGPPGDPHTAHTTNPVPVVYLAPDGTAGGRRIRENGTLADVAPTVLDLAGVDRPTAMTGTSLLE